MSLKFSKKEHILITEAIRNYIKHLEYLEYASFSYIEELRNFLGKLLRETDWSYILWTSPRKGIAGKIKILKSYSTEYPRGSKWFLFYSGILRLSSFFRSRKINLVQRIHEIQSKPQSNDNCICSMALTANEFMEIETRPEIFTCLKEIETLAQSPATKERTLPSLIMLDSIQFTLDNKNNDQANKSKLLQIRDLHIQESYGLPPEYIKRRLVQYFEEDNSGRIKLEIGQESLLLLQEILSEYCELIETSIQSDSDQHKLDKALKLAEIFRAASK